MNTEIAIEQFADTSAEPAVRGFLHRPPDAAGDGLVLTHGAGSTCQTDLLAGMAEAFAGAGFLVLRVNLPFRELRSYGPPRPGDAAKDRQALKNAVGVMRKLGAQRAFLGGHSYGGRQATMLCAENANLADGLLLLSYPLHPSRKPEQLRTQHLPQLSARSLFVHGTRDPLGSIPEMEAALALIPAPTRLLAIEGAGHDLKLKGKEGVKSLADKVLMAFQDFMKK